MVSGTTVVQEELFMNYRNQHYWNNKKEMLRKAQEHDALMRQYFCNFREDHSISTIYSQEVPRRETFVTSASPSIEIWDRDSVKALFLFGRERTAVLNFASYKHPGGAFLAGSTAQEESLLYTVIENSIQFEIQKMKADIIEELKKANVDQDIIKQVFHVA